ncbi:hypothetical protein BDV93DRAFT_273188 [Ceratobasidium sp. AG-I]|nr:hypothetical protein BDV93DRAFT_273188 [Ceratobasidium sp. AG-I]
MSTLLEHFKPPPLASDPPAKTKFWPAPPKGTTGGILQRPKPVSNVSISVSASSSSSLLSVPPAFPPPSPSVTSSRVSFAPLPDLATRKRRNSITLGVAARSAALRKMKEQRSGPPPSPNAGPQPNTSGGGGAAAGPRPPIPQPHPRSNSASLGKRSGGGGMQYTYQSYQAGLPRPRRPSSKDDQVSLLDIMT